MKKLVQQKILYFQGFSATLFLHSRTISCEQEQYYLEDLGSKNGTYVNGTELEASTPVLLKDKTVIRFANQEFLFLLEK